MLDINSLPNGYLEALDKIVNGTDQEKINAKIFLKSIDPETWD